MHRENGTRPRRGRSLTTSCFRWSRASRATTGYRTKRLRRSDRGPNPDARDSWTWTDVHCIALRRSNIATVPLFESIRRIVARRPLDWARGAGRARATPPADVDIIIPIYGAAAELRACLESVVRETDA